VEICHWWPQQAGRKQHNRGWKHRENVKLYYEQFMAGQGGMMTRA
jgi:U1 small nuclear ribonucleoprotein C